MGWTSTTRLPIAATPAAFASGSGGACRVDDSSECDQVREPWAQMINRWGHQALPSPVPFAAACSHQHVQPRLVSRRTRNLDTARKSRKSHLSPVVISLADGGMIAASFSSLQQREIIKWAISPEQNRARVLERITFLPSGW